jgi:hypothetical protein
MVSGSGAAFFFPNVTRSSVGEPLARASMLERIVRLGFIDPI